MIWSISDTRPMYLEDNTVGLKFPSNSKTLLLATVFPCRICKETLHCSQKTALWHLYFIRFVANRVPTFEKYAWLVMKLWSMTDHWRSAELIESCIH